jgi:hypothetical protein
MMLPVGSLEAEFLRFQATGRYKRGDRSDRKRRKKL